VSAAGRVADAVRVRAARGHRGLALATLCAVLALTFLDNTIVSVALANMQLSLNAGVSSLQWIVDGYMLAFTGLMLTGGTLGDIYGRKKVMLGGIAIFLAGSLGGALANSSNTLIAARVAMGVGAAGCEPGTLSMIRQIFPEARLRARALGVWTAVSGISLALGPVLGGVLVAGWSWRAIFWFNVCFAAAMLLASWLVLPESADPEGRRLDVPGLVVGAIAVTSLTFAVIEGENVGYRTWWVPLLFAVSGSAFAIFVYVERRAPDPVVRLEFFRIRAFSGATAVAFATSFGLFAVFFFTALYLQVIVKFSGWRIALQFLAMSAAMVVAGLIAGRWTSARGPRRPMAAGCALAGGSIFAVDALLDPNVAFGPLALALAGVGAGLGLALVAVTASVLSIVPPARSGMAASTLNTSRELGGVLAVATLGAVVHAQLVGQLSHKLVALGIPEALRNLVIQAITHGGLPANALAAAAQNPVVAKNFKLLGGILDEAKASFGHGLHIALVIAASIMLAGAVVSVLAGGGRESAG
jgi:MFS family permease